MFVFVQLCRDRVDEQVLNHWDVVPSQKYNKLIKRYTEFSAVSSQVTTVLLTVLGKKTYLVNVGYYFRFVFLKIESLPNKFGPAIFRHHGVGFALQTITSVQTKSDYLETLQN